MTYLKLDVPHEHSLKPDQAQRCSMNGILKSALFVAVAALFLTSSTAFSQEIGPSLQGATRPSSSAGQSMQNTQDILAGQDTGSADAYATTVAYVSQFYPLWFTYYQSKVDSLIGTSNLMVGSDRVTPLYHFVVAINYDTLYSGVYSTFPPNPSSSPSHPIRITSHSRSWFWTPTAPRSRPKSRCKPQAPMPLPDPTSPARFRKELPAFPCPSTIPPYTSGWSN